VAKGAAGERAHGAIENGLRNLAHASGTSYRSMWVKVIAAKVPVIAATTNSQTGMDSRLTLRHVRPREPENAERQQNETPLAPPHIGPRPMSSLAPAENDSSALYRQRRRRTSRGSLPATFPEHALAPLVTRTCSREWEVPRERQRVSHIACVNNCGNRLPQMAYRQARPGCEVDARAHPSPRTFCL